MKFLANGFASGRNGVDAKRSQSMLFAIGAAAGETGVEDIYGLTMEFFDKGVQAKSTGSGGTGIRA